MTDVVVGAGLTGLVAAALLAEHQNDVIVLDGAPTAGGLLRSFDYGDEGTFDCGTHLLSETGIEALDRVLLGALPEDGWQFHEGVRRDPAGYYDRGRLHTSSPYLDLRELPDPEWRRALGDLAGRWRAPDAGDAPATTAADVLESRFGSALARDHAGPVAEKVHRAPLDDLAPSALGALPLDRVVLFDEPELADLMGSATIRRRIAVPDQRRLPAAYRSTLRSFYPRSGGMQAAVDGMVGGLRARGVEVRLGVKVDDLVVEGDAVTAVVADGEPLRADRVLWTSGLPPLARALGLATPDLPTDRPLATVLVHLRVAAEPSADGTFYLYSWERSHATFRVTNYAEFCPGSVGSGTWPLTVEMLVEPSDADADDDALRKRAVAEVAEMGVLAPDTVTFSAVERLAAGFPRLTLANQRFLDAIRTSILDRDLANLLLLGIQSEPGLFLQHEVLSSLHRRLRPAD